MSSLGFADAYEVEDDMPLVVQQSKSSDYSKNPFFNLKIMKKSNTGYVKSTSAEIKQSVSSGQLNDDEPTETATVELKTIYNNLPESFKKSLMEMAAISKVASHYMSQRVLPLPSEHKKCVFLDLDETVIRKMPASQANKYAQKLEYMLMGDYVIVKRPNLDQFLEKIGMHYDIYAFTSATMPYATVVVNFINCRIKFIKGIYSRSECLPINGHYVKDLRISGRSKCDTLLIDNCIQSFSMQPYNGVYIKPFIGEDGKDDELNYLSEFLLKHVKCADIRKVVGSTFCIGSLLSYCNDISN